MFFSPLQIFDPAFTIGDVILALTLLATVLIFVVPYRKRYGGPTRQEFLELKQAYSDHVRKDEEQFNNIIGRLSSIDVNTAVNTERMENLKTKIDEQTSDLKKDLREIKDKL